MKGARDYLSRSLEGRRFRSGELRERMSLTGSLSSIRRRSQGVPPWGPGDRIKGRFEVHQVTEDRVIGVWRDGNDVEHLRVHRLER